MFACVLCVCFWGHGGLQDLRACEAVQAFRFYFYFSGTSGNNPTAELSLEHPPAVINHLTLESIVTVIFAPPSQTPTLTWLQRTEKCLWCVLVPDRNLQNVDPFWAWRALTPIHGVLMGMFQGHLFSPQEICLGNFLGNGRRACNPWIITDDSGCTPDNFKDQTSKIKPK